MLKVFISWSGERSKQIAEILKLWIPLVIQAAKPYYSPDDITKGTRWDSEIAQMLEESRIGIICLTKENLKAPWILFEAGALSKNIDKSKVVPILFEVEPSEIEGPLAQFQAARFEEKEIKKVIKMFNSELGENKLSSDTIDSVFKMWWPTLETKISDAMHKEIVLPEESKRSEKDLLEEILMIVRAQSLNSPISKISPAAAKDLSYCFIELVEAVNKIDYNPELYTLVQRISKPVRHIARHYMTYVGENNFEAINEVYTSLKNTASSEE